MPAEGGGTSAVGGGSVGGTAQLRRTFRKGPFLKELDRKSRATSRAEAEDILKALLQLRDKSYPAGLRELIEQELPGTHADDRKHVKAHWLDAWEEPWKAEQVLVNGLIKALEAAIAGSPSAHEILPFDCYWVSETTGFEVVVTSSDRQVNLLIFTPAIGGPVFGGSYPEDEEVWSVRKGTARPWETVEHASVEAGVITAKQMQRPPGGGTG